MELQLSEKNFLVTIPHAGEKVPDYCDWLRNLPEPILMEDVDRFVDVIYQPAIQELQLQSVKTEWHRYAVDLNRVPTDIDESSVQGHKNPNGSFSRGYHWVITTKKFALMKQPMTEKMHKDLTDLIYHPFHEQIQFYQKKIRSINPAVEVFHLDLHSMPSLGTNEHRDPGELRADIVVSDCIGKSARPDFVDKVITAYCRAGFKVAYNWPYFGGRLTEQYGQPKKGCHTVQVELNRAIYMDEVTKQIKKEKLASVQEQLTEALRLVLKK